MTLCWLCASMLKNTTKLRCCKENVCCGSHYRHQHINLKLGGNATVQLWRPGCLWVYSSFSLASVGLHVSNVCTCLLFTSCFTFKVSIFFINSVSVLLFLSLDSGIVLTCVYYIYLNSVCFVWHWVKNNKHMNIIEKSIHPCPQVVGVVWAARPCFPQPPPCPTFPGGGKVPKLAKRCNHSSVSLVCPGASSRGPFPVWHVQNTLSRRCPGGILVRCPNCLTPFVVEDEQLYSEWPWPVSKAGRS